MSNIKAVDPAVAWGLFQGWAARMLRYEPDGTTMTLVDYSAAHLRSLRRPRLSINPVAYLSRFDHDVAKLSHGMWRVNRGVLTGFQLLELINYYRHKSDEAPAELEDLRLE